MGRKAAKDPVLTQQQFLHFAKVPPRDLKELRAAGLPSTIVKRRLFYSVDSVRWVWARRLAEKDDAAGPTLDRARTKKTIAHAELAELKVAQARGHLIAVDDAEAEITDVLGALRQGILNIPSRWGGQLLGIDNHAEMEVALQRVARELLDSLRRNGDGDG